MFIKIKAFAVFTHPADGLGRIAYQQGISWNVFQDNCPCSNKGIGPNADAAQYGSIGSNGNATFHPGFAVLSLAVDGTAWIVHVGEHHRWPQKHIVCTDDPRIQRYVVLHFDIFSQNHPISNKHVLSQNTLFTNYSTWHDMTEMPDFGARSNLGTRVDDGGGMLVEHGVERVEKV